MGNDAARYDYENDSYRIFKRKNCPMSQAKINELLSVVKGLPAISGMPNSIDFAQVIVTMTMIGRILQQIHNGDRCNTIHQMRNLAHEFRHKGVATPTSVILETLISSWENPSGSTEKARIDMTKALNHIL